MADLSWLNLMVLTVVVLVIMISFSRFIRRCLNAGCDRSRGCAGCSGCDRPADTSHSSRS